MLNNGLPRLELRISATHFVTAEMDDNAHKIQYLSLKRIGDFCSIEEFKTLNEKDDRVFTTLYSLPLYDSSIFMFYPITFAITYSTHLDDFSVNYDKIFSVSIIGKPSKNVLKQIKYLQNIISSKSKNGIFYGDLSKEKENSFITHYRNYYVEAMGTKKTKEQFV